MHEPPGWVDDGQHLVRHIFPVLCIYVYYSVT